MNGIFVFTVILVSSVIVIVLFSKKKSVKPLNDKDLQEEPGSFDSPKQKERAKSLDFPYQKSKTLFTPAERSFLGVLDKAVKDNAMICGKVRVADVIIPQKGLSKGEWQTAFNKTSRKHFDFVLCRKDDLSIICAVELDDKSHNSDKRHKRDEFLKGACAASGIPLIQVPAKKGYVLDEVKQLLAPYLCAERMAVESHIPQTESEDVLSTEKICPKCASPMVKRIAKKGSNVGNEFWACSAFPKCRYVDKMPVEPMKKNFEDLELNINVTESNQVNANEVKKKKSLVLSSES